MPVSTQSPQRQHIWMTLSRQLFQFVLCCHPTPRCWSSQKRELSLRVGLFRSRLHTLGTYYHPTLDPAVLWTPSNDTSRPIFSDSLNLTLPAPLYLRTLWRYTNAVIIIIIIIHHEPGIRVAASFHRVCSYLPSHRASLHLYTVWWQRHLHEHNLTKATAQRCPAGSQTLDCQSNDLLIIGLPTYLPTTPTIYHNTSAETATT